MGQLKTILPQQFSKKSQGLLLHWLSHIKWNEKIICHYRQDQGLQSGEFAIAQVLNHIQYRL